MENLIKDMLALFLGRTDKLVGFARGKPMNFKLRIPSQEIPRYLLRHFKGHQRIGFYNFLSDGTCPWSVIEFDKEDESENFNKAIKFRNALSESGLRAYLERSYTDRGFRVWIFFSRPADSSQIRKFLKMVMEKIEIFDMTKIYPTEDTDNAGEDNDGEYIWLPFYGGTEDPVGKSIKQEHNLFLDDSGKTIPVDMSLKLITSNDPGILPEITTSLSRVFLEPPVAKISRPVRTDLKRTKEREIKKTPEVTSSSIEPDLEINMLDKVIDNLFLWLNSETFSPVSTGFKTLDRAINGGLQVGKLMEINGGNAVERVNFCFQILDQISRNNAGREIPVVALYVSRRFSKEELVLKSICRIGEFDEDYLEGRKWKEENNPEEFIQALKKVTKSYHDMAKWIMVLRMEYRVKVNLIKYAIRQLSYNYNTPCVILVIEDPFLSLYTSSEENSMDILTELHMLAQYMTVPVIILNDTSAVSAGNYMDGIIHMSFQLNTDEKTIKSFLEDRDLSRTIAPEKVKALSNRDEKPALLRIKREKTGREVILPFLIRKKYNQFLEIN